MEKKEITSNRSGLWLLGGIAASLSELFFRPNYSAEFDVFNGFGIFTYPEIHPETVLEWFVLFRKTPLVGMVLLEGADLIHYGLVAVIFLVLFFCIRFRNTWMSWLALGLGSSGVLIYMVGNKAFEFYELSKGYFLANAAQDADLFLRGEQILSMYNPLTISWMDAGKFLIMVSGLMFSIGMFGSEVFSRATGIFGLVSNGIGLLFFPVILWLPEYYVLPTPISAPFRLVWHLLIAINLLRFYIRSRPE